MLISARGPHSRAAVSAPAGVAEWHLESTSCPAEWACRHRGHVTEVLTQGLQRIKGSASDRYGVSCLLGAAGLCPAPRAGWRSPLSLPLTDMAKVRELQPLRADGKHRVTNVWDHVSRTH